MIEILDTIKQIVRAGSMGACIKNECRPAGYTIVTVLREPFIE